MYDNQLYALIISVLNDGLTKAGVTGVQVKQGSQPTQQGAPSGPCILIDKIPGDVRFGWPAITEIWNQDTSTLVKTETQEMESTFQVGARATLDPKNLTQHTASDLVSIAAMILQGDDGRIAINNQSVGMLRVTQIRNTAFKDDKDQFEYAPSFDFTLTHQQAIISASPVVETYAVNIKRV